LALTELVSVIAVELSSSLQAQHAAAQSTTSALKFNIVTLETLVKPQAAVHHLQNPNIRISHRIERLRLNDHFKEKR